ncbi:hypothetical protein ACS0TY_000068 [Phlomoides rotata]
MKEVLVDPMETPSRHMFERSAIEKWLLEKHQCPITSNPLETSMLRPKKTPRKELLEVENSIGSQLSSFLASNRGTKISCGIAARTIKM